MKKAYKFKVNKSEEKGPRRRPSSTWGIVLARILEKAGNVVWMG
jgi:hypothetical protein